MVAADRRRRRRRRRRWRRRCAPTSASTRATATATTAARGRVLVVLAGHRLRRLRPLLEHVRPPVRRRLRRRRLRLRVRGGAQFWRNRAILAQFWRNSGAIIGDAPLPPQLCSMGSDCGDCGRRGSFSLQSETAATAAQPHLVTRLGRGPRRRLRPGRRRSRRRRRRPPAPRRHAGPGAGGPAALSAKRARAPPVGPPPAGEPQRPPLPYRPEPLVPRAAASTVASTAASRAPFPTCIKCT